jgi:hypothetical protein
MNDPTELIERMARDRSDFAGRIDRNYPSARVKRVNIWNSILDKEIETGSTFLVSMPDVTPYLCVGLTRETFVIPRSGKGGDKFWSYMDRRYGLTESEGNDNIARYILNRFRNYAIQQGSRVELRRFSAFRNTPEKQTVYISGYNGLMWRLDGENVMPIGNGEDDIFFADDDGGRPVEPQVGDNGTFFDKLVNSISFSTVGMGGISADQMRMAYTIWVFSLAFPDLMPTKPLLILEGAPGSGKSASLQLLQRALLGQGQADHPVAQQRGRLRRIAIALADLRVRQPRCLHRLDPRCGLRVHDGGRMDQAEVLHRLRRADAQAACVHRRSVEEPGVVSPRGRRRSVRHHAARTTRAIRSVRARSKSRCARRGRKSSASTSTT